jgi:putative ABC transport system ATP-binding protein
MRVQSAVEPAAILADRRNGEHREIAAEAVVRANGISRRYGEGDTAVDALRGISLDIQDGRLTAVMGPSGSGKSTLMHRLARNPEPPLPECDKALVEIWLLFSGADPTAAPERIQEGRMTTEATKNFARKTAQRGDIAVHAVDLCRTYGEGDTAVNALCGVSLDVPTGRLTAIMGPSGSGKSTLMHILAGLDKPTSGSVEVGGQEITTLDDTALTKLRRKHVGFIFQFFNLLPMLTARENIVLPLEIAGQKVDPDWFNEVVTKVRLSKRLSHRPAQLSGGQQQRVAIARALISRPTVLFADEPTGNLDSRTGGEILDLLHDSVETLGQTIVMVTHDARVATIADRVLFLGDGAIVKELPDTTPEEIQKAIQEIGRN